MARDLSLPLRQAILAALEDSPAVTAIVPADRIHAVEVPAQPVWPFLRYGAATPSPFRSSGADGLRLMGTVHAFARGPGEDAVAALAAAVAAVLDGADARGLLLTLDGGEVAHLAWTGTQLRRDGDEAGAHHALIGFTAVVP